MGAEIGMLVVETIAKIRRAYFVHGQPIKAICRDLGVSRKIVRKVIRSEATEFRYEREAQPLRQRRCNSPLLFQRAKRPSSNLGWRPVIDECIHHHALYRSQRFPVAAEKGPQSAGFLYDRLVSETA